MDHILNLSCLSFKIVKYRCCVNNNTSNMDYIAGFPVYPKHYGLCSENLLTYTN